MRKFLRHTLVMLAVVVAALSGCGLIDEALEVCREVFSLFYRLRLITNLPEEMDGQLSDERDRPLQLALEDHLKDIFAEYARDVDLSFYATDPAGQRLEHRSAVMNAGQATYEIALPAADYHHLALANLAGNPVVQLTGADLRDETCLQQQAGEVVDSHTTGLFSARLPLSVQRNESRTFDVNLYMVNDAGALVVHRDSCDYVSIRAELLDLASGFRVCDSLYDFSARTSVSARLIDAAPFVEEGRPQWNKLPALLCGVGFPSLDTPVKADEAIWRFALYVTLQDGTTTLSLISIGVPLQAGHLKIIRGYLKPDGRFVPGPPGPEPSKEPVVGVSVQLDWREGMHFEPPL